ncbi:uncharacterized protein BX663DRAFT_519040 [Cokeromyces recurvatus]|uniref:uncharacterized protein n=1 Tax=Cokeromyces recurvatus TaxID=90255 RepID=UPI00221FB77C|nr:uncharacterized protein BX663DRAFT_519040 [Cokeromyces recurvatus]KAI7899937.1 hypothetical protein BX663DRAFT_519040 [Cokeromyces recurvatus]
MRYSDIHFQNSEQNMNQKTLRGPRPLITSTYMKPLEIYMHSSLNKYQQKSKYYTYPIPSSLEERFSKTQVTVDNLPSPAKSSSTKAIDEDVSSSPVQNTFPNRKKRLPHRPAPAPKESISMEKPVICYYSSDEEEEEEEEKEGKKVLQDLNVSRRMNTFNSKTPDVKVKDEEKKKSSNPLTRSSSQKPLPNYNSYHNEPANSSKNNTSSAPPPPIPVISAPGYSDDEDEKVKNNNNNSMPTIPTICAPGGLSDDEDEKQDQRKSKTKSLFGSLYFGIRCAGCDEPLSGQAITTFGKHWHPHCFKCQSCHQNLEHIAFYEKEGMPYCALDYHELFSPRCDYCKTPIEEHSISALGKTYHPGHFFCRECGKPFDEETTFLEHDGHAYCEKDYYKQFGKACKGCEEIITGDFLVALGGEWHKECFVCADCGGTFSSSTFLIRGGKPYCEEHYDKQRTHHKKKNSLLLKETPLTNLPQLDLLPPILGEDNKKETIEKICHHCEKPIEGRSHSAFGFDYHPLHFQCSQCNKLLSVRVKGLYQSTENNELICNPCIRKNRILYNLS